MFENIEKSYKRNLIDYKFNIFYYKASCGLIFISYLFKISDDIKPYFIFFSLIIAGMAYLFAHILTNINKLNINNKISLLDKIKIYFKEEKKGKYVTVIKLLKKYNIKTKSDLKLTIDYFNSKKSIKVESDYLGWIVSFILTVSSLMEIAYDSEKNAINLEKISIIFGYSFKIILSFLIPIILFKRILNQIFISKDFVRTKLIDDLYYIYLNFDKYKNQLSK